MGFALTVVSAGAVRPSSPTPARVRLPLAYFDRHPQFRESLADSMHIYLRPPAGVNPATAIRAALAKALVLYYPMAGRLVEDEPGDVAVECSGDGAYFVEAEASYTLEDLEFLERPAPAHWAALLPEFSGDESWRVEPRNTLLMMQVTSFRCGGFVVGLRCHHAVADGIGSSMILAAVGDLARGLPEPEIIPFWRREVFPNPRINYDDLPSEDAPVLDLECIEFELPASYIKGVKSQYAGARGKYCSTFDVIAATVWQCQTRAMAELSPDAVVTFRTIMCVRHLLNLGEGYYGNATLPTSASAPCGTVRRSSILDIVDLVKEAKNSLEAELAKFRLAAMEDPLRVSPGYETLTVVDWSRMAFSAADFGSGAPKFWTAPEPRCRWPSAFILNAPAPSDDKRLMTACVGREHREAFIRERKAIGNSAH